MQKDDAKHIVTELKDILDRSFPGLIRKVLVFGSRAAGNAREDSDLDVLVVVRGNMDWRLRNEIIGACYEIDLKYDVVSDIKVLSEDDMNSIRGRQPFVQEALEKGVAA